MDDSLRHLADEIQRFSGIYIKDENSYNYKTVVEKCSRKYNYPFPSNLYSHDFLQAIIDELVIMETYFFREPTYLNSISDLVTKRSSKTAIVSLGSSTGEEAFSILFDLSEKKIAGRTEIFGFDISEKALDHAKRGIYSKHAIRKTGDQFLKYFTETDGAYVVNRNFRDKIRFLNLNSLNRDECMIYFNRFDIIVVRNFFIYFRNRLRDVMENIAIMGKENCTVITTPVEYEKAKRFSEFNIKVVAS